jgi:hypothetical protein
VDFGNYGSLAITPLLMIVAFENDPGSDLVIGFADCRDARRADDGLREKGGTWVWD